MGMFDYVRSSMYLGREFTGECQTKDIDQYGGGTMSHYWINPAGELFLIDYAHTQDFAGVDEFRFQWVPNGNHGRVSPCIITDYITIYPSSWRGQYGKLPTCRIHFTGGKVSSWVLDVEHY